MNNTYFGKVESGYYQGRPVTERVRDLLVEHSPFDSSEVDQYVQLIELSLKVGEKQGIQNGSQALTKVLDQIRPDDDIPSRLENLLPTLLENLQG